LLLFYTPSSLPSNIVLSLHDALPISTASYFSSRNVTGLELHFWRPLLHVTDRLLFIQIARRCSWKLLKIHIKHRKVNSLSKGRAMGRSISFLPRPGSGVDVIFPTALFLCWPSTPFWR